MTHLRLAILGLLFGLFVIAGSAAATQEAAAPARPVPPPAPADVKSPPADAQKSASGLYSKVVTPGSGNEHPELTDIVTVRYTGWTTDGKVFDSSALRNNRPSTFPLNRVLPGWSEGVQLMVVGETRRLWVPQALAFKGAEGKPKGMVVFDIELLEIESPISAPPDVSGPPSDAQRTVTGVFYKVLQPGTGDKHPSQSSRVTVHYTGWTTNGKAFDSSVVRGQPATFDLDKVIKGWTVGVQLMVVGEKRRFWIPEDLAYGGQAGAPAGMLVFDIELLAIEK